MDAAPRRPRPAVLRLFSGRTAQRPDKTIWKTGTTHPTPPSLAVGLAIGMTVAMDTLAGGPVTGAAVNPARYTGAAIAAGHPGELLVYWIGPMLGGGIAGWTYRQFFFNKK